MSFKILNESDDPFPGTPFALPDSVDFDVLVAGIAADGVLSGCAVTASGTTNVAVAAGVAFIGGAQVTVAAGNVAVTAGHATLNRLDLVVVDNTGAKSVVAGSPAAGQSVKFPAIPANSVALAAVWQPAAGTNVAANQVIDKRVVVQPMRAVRDTAANLAAANAVYPAGQRIEQTNAGHLVAWGDGATAYNSLPKITPDMDVGAYQYATESTTGITGVGTSGSDWSGVTITFTSDGVTPIEIEAFCPVTSGEAGLVLPAYGRLGVYEGATRIILADGAPINLASASGKGGHIIAKDTRVWSAGTHTLKVTVFRSTVGGGSGTISFFTVGSGAVYLRSRIAR